MKRLVEVLLLLACVNLLACAHRPAATATSPSAGSGSTPASALTESAPAPEAPPAAAAAEGRACSLDADCNTKELCLKGRCTAITPGLAECQGGVQAHFAFDDWRIRPDDQPSLDRLARCVGAQAGFKLSIEGNADECGTEEYNLHLGARRAQAVHKYLARSGAPAEQLSSITYGEDRPVCEEHNEACWAQNRRAEVKVK
ncbi:MAG: OmpA family protein [Myxococcales bacterium]